MVIVTSTILMIPNEFAHVQNELLAQVAMLAVLIGNYLLWLFVQVKLTGSYISNEIYLSDEEVIRYREKIGKYRGLSKCWKWIITIASVLSITIFLYLNKPFISLVLMIFYGLIVSQKLRSRKLAISKLGREVLKVFPDWMLGIALQLQTENVQVAMVKSLENVPYVLEEELEILLGDIERDPLGITPYLQFYKELGLQEINSAMKMLYVMNQYGEEEMGQQIQILVERNTMLQDASEKLKLEDYLSGMGVVILLPMLLGSGKMVIDMILLVTELLSTTKGML